MKVKVIYKDFGSRDSASNWMKQIYEKYGKKVIASNFAEDPDHVVGYATILDEPVAVEPPKTKPLIKFI